MYEVIVKKGGKLVGRMRGENIYLIVESRGQLIQSRFHKDGDSEGNLLMQLPHEPRPVLAVRDEINGIDPEVNRMVAFVTMTILDQREKHILELLSKGLTRDEIVAEMHYSDSTIKRLMQSILAKMRCQGYVEALSKYIFYKEIVGDIPLPEQEELIAIVTEGKGEKLTVRQMEVVSCAMRGLECGKTAEALHISTSTVKRERRNIYDKIGVGSMIEVVAVMAETWDKGESENNIKPPKNGEDEAT